MVMMTITTSNSIKVKLFLKIPDIPIRRAARPPHCNSLLSVMLRMFPPKLMDYPRLSGLIPSGLLYSILQNILYYIQKRMSSPSR